MHLEKDRLKPTTWFHTHAKEDELIPSFHLSLPCLSARFLSPGHTKPGRCWAVSFSAEGPVASPSQRSPAPALPASTEQSLDKGRQSAFAADLQQHKVFQQYGQAGWPHQALLLSSKPLNEP